MLCCFREVIELNAKAHIAAGVILSTAAHIYLFEYSNITILALAPFFSILPDIDIKNSLSAKLTLNLFTFIKHRTITHSLLFSFLVSLLFYFLSGYFELFICCMVSIISHLLLDMTTKKRIKMKWLFFPFFL